MRSMMLPVLFTLLVPSLAAAQSAASRTSCDSYGRCFDFVGPNDRLGDRASLWQRPDDDTAESGDPLALARGTVGEHLQALADDD